MTSLLLLVSFAVSMVGSAGAVAVGRDAAKAFDRLKTLEGRWEAEGSRAITIFEMVGNGSVLVERYANPDFPGGGHMVSAYHLDGESLMLTHYCIARNQPTLRAERVDEAAGEIQFEFVRATSLPDPNVGHMRRAMYRIESADRFTTEWDYFSNGRKLNTVAEVFTRVRQEAR